MSASPLVQDLVLAGAKIALVVGALLGLFSLMTWIERRTLALCGGCISRGRAHPRHSKRMH